jgi:hypothetical protein
VKFRVNFTICSEVSPNFTICDVHAEINKCDATFKTHRISNQFSTRPQKHNTHFKRLRPDRNMCFGGLAFANTTPKTRTYPLP